MRENAPWQSTVEKLAEFAPLAANALRRTLTAHPSLDQPLRRWPMLHRRCCAAFGAAGRSTCAGTAAVFRTRSTSPASS